MKPQEFEALARAKTPVVESVAEPIVESAPVPVLKPMDINAIDQQYHSLLGEAMMAGGAEAYAMEDEQLDGMALGELKAIAQAAKKIYTSVKQGVPLEAWMYKKITNGNEGLTAVAQQINNPAVREQQGVAESSRQSNLQPGTQVMLWLGPRDMLPNPPRDDKRYWDKGVVVSEPEMMTGSWQVLVKSERKGQSPISPGRVFVLKHQGVAEADETSWTANSAKFGHGYENFPLDKTIKKMFIQRLLKAGYPADQITKMTDDEIAKHERNLKKGMAEGALTTYLVSVMDPITGEHWRIKVEATSPEMAKERAEAMGYKVLRISEKPGVTEAVWDRHSQSHIPRDGRTFGQTNHPREEHCDSCGAPTGHAGPGEDSNVDDNGNVYCDDCYADEPGVAEGIQFLPIDKFPKTDDENQSELYLKTKDGNVYVGEWDSASGYFFATDIVHGNHPAGNELPGRMYNRPVAFAVKQGVAEGETGRPGTTPGFQDTLAADEKRREQRRQERKAQDKSTMQGINKNRAKADAYRKSGVADDGRKQQFRATGHGGMPPTDDEGNPLHEMDSQPPQGRIKSDGTRSHSTYGSRDGHNITGPDLTAKTTTPKKVIKKGTDILDRAFKDADKKDPNDPNWSKKYSKDVAEGQLDEIKQRLDPKCWKGKHKEGTKIKGGVRVNNCVPNESTDYAAQVNSLLNEFAGGMGAGSVASAPGRMQNPAKVGSLFGGSYSPKSPFKKKPAKKKV